MKSGFSVADGFEDLGAFVLCGYIIKAIGMLPRVKSIYDSISLGFFDNVSIWCDSINVS